MCVSFKQEEGAKGPMAKDVRLEDPERVARVTAKVRYGTVEVKEVQQCKARLFISLTCNRAISIPPRRDPQTATASSFLWKSLEREHRRSESIRNRAECYH